MQCPKCGTQLQDDALFCKECGTRIETILSQETKDLPEEPSPVCPKCGVQLQEGALFCKECGSKVETSAPQETEKPFSTPTEEPAAPEASAETREFVPLTVTPDHPEPEKSTANVALDDGWEYEASEDEPETEKKKKTGLIIGIIAAAVAAMAAAGILLWIFLAPSGSDTIAEQESQVTSEPTAQETVTISPVSPTVQAGKNVMLTASIDQDIEDRTVRSAAWTSNDPSIATVEDGVVHGIKEGSVRITVVYLLSDGNSVSGETTVTVTAADTVYSVSITPDSVSLETGASYILDAQPEQSLDDSVKILSTVWSSSNEAVATVSNGRVAGVSAGSATVSATISFSNGQSASASVPVTVTAPAVSSSPSSAAQPSTSDGSYILPDSNTSVISYEKLRSMSDQDLMLARNEIYARHGRRFLDQSLQSYFDGKSWYHGTIAPDDFDSSVLSSVEIQNIDRIVEVERER